MKTLLPKYIIFRVLKFDGRWYASNLLYDLIGGTRLKRELMEFMEEEYNADIIGNNIFVPEKSLK